MRGTGWREYLKSSDEKPGLTVEPTQICFHRAVYTLISTKLNFGETEP